MTAAAVGSFTMWGSISAAVICLAPGIPPRIKHRLLGVATLLALAAVVTLAAALVGTDFSLAYVTETTSLSTPWPYRLAALWGGMDGSMLFYATLTLVLGWLGAHRLGFGAAGVGVVALVGAGYLLITAIIANPFETLPIPAVDGDGLLGILQHPAMIYHPPILYLGLTALVVPAAFVIDRSGSDITDGRWVSGVRGWLLVAWMLLTAGMAAGANWAYIELGWGGFWAWDPVENTALMPWLAITGFLHVSRIRRREGRLRRLNVFLVLLAFSLTILGVYLTRSGATGSIHSFAEDPLIGRVLMGGALAAVFLATLAALRSPRGESWGNPGLGRETWLSVNVALLGLALIFVTVGSAYPAVVQVLTDDVVTVSSRFFVTTLFPIALVTAGLLAVVLRIGWRWSRLALGDVFVLVAVAAVVALAAVVTADSPSVVSVSLLALAGGSLALLVVQLVLHRGRRRALPGYLAHAGVAMLLLGAAGSAMGGEVRSVMSPGEDVVVAGRHIELVALTTGETDRFVFAEAEVRLDGSHTLRPQIRGYEEQSFPIAEPAIHSSPASDVIVAISLLFPDAAAADVSVFVRPLVWWVWAGALAVSVAGLLAIVARDGGGAGRRRGAREERQPADTTT